MDKQDFKELEEALENIDLGITEKDGFLGRFFKKQLTSLIKKCVQDKSGAAIYKVTDVFLSIAAPSDIPKDTVAFLDDGCFCNTNKALKQVYKCCDRMLDKMPELTEELIPVIFKRANQQENDVDNVKQVFALSEKIAHHYPDFKTDTVGLKKAALDNLCLNKPQQGLMMISSMISETYPTKDDLAVIYSGFSVLLNASDLKKESYEPMLKLLEVCAESGYNTGENAKKLNEICNTISNKTPKFGVQIARIKATMLKQAKQNGAERVEKTARKPAERREPLHPAIATARKRLRESGGM